MNEVLALRRTVGMTQRGLAEAAGTSQPTVAAYEHGRKSPSLRTLRRLARAAGLEMSVEFHPALTREERRSLFLHRAIARCVAEDPDRAIGRARRTLARMKDANPHARPLLDEWEALLERPVEQLLPVLTDPRPRARELRHVTPFAGLLGARERATVYRAFAEAEQAAS